MMTLTSTQIGQLVAQFFLAGAGTLSFAVLFACPKRTLPCCALVGAVGWFVYELAVLYGADAAAAHDRGLREFTVGRLGGAFVFVAAAGHVSFSFLSAASPPRRGDVFGISVCTRKEGQTMRILSEACPFPSICPAKTKVFLKPSIRFCRRRPNRFRPSSPWSVRPT